MRILLLGANGQLGRTFLDHGGLAARGELTIATRDGALAHGGHGETADLSIPESLPALLDRVRPEVIVNAAAYTASKLAGEQALRGSGADHLTLRTAWVYAPHGHNFLRTMLRLGAERDELRVVSDQHGAPTDTGLIVDGTLAALDRWLQSDSAQRRARAGTHHLVAGGATSWHGFASAIFEQAVALGVLARLPRVVPISSAEFPTPAVRPAWSLLDNGGFRQHFDFPLPDWQHGLHDVMRRLAASGH